MDKWLWRQIWEGRWEGVLGILSWSWNGGSVGSEWLCRLEKDERGRTIQDVESERRGKSMLPKSQRDKIGMK